MISISRQMPRTAPAARHALMVLVGGPLVLRRRGWCRRGHYAPVVTVGVMDTLERRGAVVTRMTAMGRCAELTAGGRTLAAAIAADIHDALDAAAEIGRAWLAARATAAEAARGGIRPGAHLVAAAE